ncbi:hypothetical protein BD324DRAFT_653316 [Kockovaella imperatae]|uniref:Uncharacterized protein n=1 Tax=Kockovaella imperatae TaxID=4999 RepID=A0A1Y1U951_9TREE|nr:hypothetical protein BD324DRAFT_653316 [Kockovaella imperatae]ORX34542.1 hypothetical protein BD324DRAFT_653316 [Kockovaella imperatae]
MPNVVNVTLDNVDPNIKYSGNWNGNAAGDRFYASYYDQTFQSSGADGDYFEFSWTGGDVFLYGGYGSDHGYYSLIMDGGDKIYANGYSDPGAARQLIGASSGYPYGQHTVRLTNENQYNPTEGRTLLDLDYIVVELDPEADDGGATTSSTATTTTSTAPVISALPSTTRQVIDGAMESQTALRITSNSVAPPPSTTTGITSSSSSPTASAPSHTSSISSAASSAPVGSRLPAVGGPHITVQPGSETVPIAVGSGTPSFSPVAIPTDHVLSGPARAASLSPSLSALMAIILVTWALGASPHG